MSCSRLFPVFVAFTLLSATLQAQSVSSVGVGKLSSHWQTSPTTTTPAWFEFQAFIDGDVTPSFPSGPRHVRTPLNQTHNLLYDEDSWGIHQDFGTAAQLNAAFPDGAYTVTIGAQSVPLALTGGAYPGIPIATVTAGTWSAGKFRVTASQAAAGFRITSSQNSGNGFASIDIWSDQVEFDMFQVQPTGFSSVSIDVPAGALLLGRTYTVAVEFDNVVDSKPINVSAGANAFAIYSSATEFDIEVVANPVPQAAPTDVSISLVQNPDNSLSAALTWTSASTHRYVLESSIDFATWTTVGRTLTTVVGLNSRTITSPEEGRRFYRLRSIE